MFGVEIGRERHQGGYFSVKLPDVYQYITYAYVPSNTQQWVAIQTRVDYIHLLWPCLFHGFLALKRALACNEGGASGLRFSTHELLC